jgi:hypothetical protein
MMQSVDLPVPKDDFGYRKMHVTAGVVESIDDMIIAKRSAYGIAADNRDIPSAKLCIRTPEGQDNVEFPHHFGPGDKLAIIGSHVSFRLDDSKSDYGPMDMLYTKKYTMTVMNGPLVGVTFRGEYLE